MKTITLTPKEPTQIPIEAECITPDNIAGKTIEQISRLAIYQGNKNYPLTTFFTVTGKTAETPDEQLVLIDGDAPHIKYIGRQMTTGKIVIEGDTGMHTGAQMKGGELTVKGNTGNWAGAELSGGLLRVLGNAGHLLGAAYRGSAEGMTGGCIIVKGNAGSEIGSFMRRGMLIIGGDTGPFTGVHMNGGEIFIFGKAGKRVGAQAKGNGGFIACLGGVTELLPTYRYDTTYTPTFMRLYIKQLVSLGISEASKYYDLPMKRYRGDLAIGGTAEILIMEKTSN